MSENRPDGKSTGLPPGKKIVVTPKGDVKADDILFVEVDSCVEAAPSIGKICFRETE